MSYRPKRQLCDKCGMPGAAGERIDRCVLCREQCCDSCAASFFLAKPRTLPVCRDCKPRIDAAIERLRKEPHEPA